MVRLAEVDMKVEANISTAVRNHIDITFRYDPTYVAKIREVTGARFVPADKGGPMWRVPLDLEIGRELRAAFGDELKLGKGLHGWATKRSRRKKTLVQLALAEHADCNNLRRLNPDLWEAIYIGPKGKEMTPEQRAEALKSEFGSYQTADVAYMSQCENPINALHPGLGKTLETIASVFESELHEGPKLVIAPLTALETVWVDHLINWQWQDTILCAGPKHEREAAVALAEQYAKEGTPFWFVTNPATIQYQAEYEYHPLTQKRMGIKEMWLKHPELHEIEWDVIILDEFHQFGLGNPQTLTAKALYDLRTRDGGKKIAMSGTPIGGRPVKLFGALHFLYPDDFTSKWRFADQWLTVSMGNMGHKQVGDVREEKQKEFDEFISQYMIRRTKADVAPWLPAKQHVDVWCEMTPGQSKQYKEFALAAETKIEDMNLSATSILAEYTRLKQFADAKQTITPIDEPPFFRPTPTDDSGKLAHVEEILRELGILGGEDEKEGNEQCVIFSQFTQVIDMMYDWLKKKNVQVARITGAVSTQDRKEIVGEFQRQDSAIQVCLINTKAGGVAITLDRANTVIFMDETWVPDDQEQAEDRVHRASRIHQVTVYTLRSKGTIEEAIMKKVQDKNNINQRILDLRREGLTSLYKEEA